MKQLALFLAVSALAWSVRAADPKAAVTDAVKALKEKGNYSWTTTSEVAGGQFPAFVTKGKTEKDGYSVVTAEGQNGPMEAVRKGDKGVAKTEQGWKTADELTQGGDFSTFFYVGLLTSPLPADDAENLLKFAKEIKDPREGKGDGKEAKDGTLYTVMVSNEGATDLNTFRFGRGRAGGQGFPPPKEAKASAKFWIKDGGVVKFEVSTSAKRAGPDGEEREWARTATTEISAVGSTKVEASEDAKKKL